MESNSNSSSSAYQQLNNQNAVLQPNDQAQEYFIGLLRVSDQTMKEHINAAVDSKDECPENFKCVICQCLVFEPEQCLACDNMYCKSCIKEWKKDKCPLCQKTLNLAPLNRILKGYLDETSLKGCPITDCESHKLSMSY